MTSTINDPIHSVVDICRDAIDAGLLDLDRETFDNNVVNISGASLEDYLQEAWDKIPSKTAYTKVFTVQN